MFAGPVSEVLIYPVGKYEFLAGDFLTCTANGRPEPNVTWTNIDDGTIIQQSELAVVGAWVGTIQRWRCDASNTIAGTHYQKAASITFSVTVARK